MFRCYFTSNKPTRTAYWYASKLLCTNIYYLRTFFPNLSPMSSCCKSYWCFQRLSTHSTHVYAHRQHTHPHPLTHPHTCTPPHTHTHSTHVYAHRQHVMIMIVRILATLFKGQLRKETLCLHEEPLPAIWMRSAHLITLCALDHPPGSPQCS